MVIIPEKTHEQRMEEYAKSIRNAVHFIAWVIAIGIGISVIAGIVIAVQINHTANSVNDISNCQSVGGTDPSC